MFVYLLPVHLSLLIFGLVMSENSTNITVQVSANGSDTPSCIQDNMSCKTMLYVLDQISNMSKNFHQSTSVTINIACNQIIESLDPYKFTSSFPLSVRLIGHNNASIVLNYNNLIILSENQFNWTWIGFTIFTYTYGVLLHENMDSFAMRNCKIMTIKLTISNAHNVVIDSTEFRGAFERNSLCPSITVITVSHSTSITLSNQSTYVLMPRWG